MSVSMELKDSLARLRVHIEQLTKLIKGKDVTGVADLTRKLRTDPAFASEWRRIWSEVARADGGKISVTTVCAVLGAVLGGVGIAFGGGAFGLPLALVLGLGGLFAGSEIDLLRGPARRRLMRLPDHLLKRIQSVADSAGLPAQELIVQTLEAAFPPDEAR